MAERKEKPGNELTTRVLRPKHLLWRQIFTLLSVHGKKSYTFIVRRKKVCFKHEGARGLHAYVAFLSLSYVTYPDKQEGKIFFVCFQTLFRYFLFRSRKLQPAYPIFFFSYYEHCFSKLSKVISFLFVETVAKKLSKLKNKNCSSIKTKKKKKLLPGFR